jgi:hypothetical protein
MPPKRKPVAVQATGFQNIEKLRGEFDGTENIVAARERQVFLLRRRFVVSLPVARLIAELHYGAAA